MTTDHRINRKRVVEDNLVDRYLLGQMDEAEAMAFEDFYAGSPETLAELETSARLIDSVQRAARDGSMPAQPVAAVPAVTAARRRYRLSTLIGSPLYGAAASVVAVVALVLALGGEPGAGGKRAAPAHSINIPVVTLSPTRGADNGIIIDAGDATQVVFALDLGLATAASYSAALQTSDGDMLWRGDGLLPDPLQSLTMGIPGVTLPAGDYRIVVRSEDLTGDTLTFPFSIIR